MVFSKDDQRVFKYKWQTQEMEEANKYEKTFTVETKGGRVTKN